MYCNGSTIYYKQLLLFKICVFMGAELFLTFICALFWATVSYRPIMVSHQFYLILYLEKTKIKMQIFFIAIIVYRRLYKKGALKALPTSLGVVKIPANSIKHDTSRLTPLCFLHIRIYLLNGLDLQIEIEN